MRDCQKCVCMNCDANNKLHDTDPLNTCYGCDGNNEACNRTITVNDCLYQQKLRLKGE